MVCKAYTDRGLVYRAKGRIFNNMLYLGYVCVCLTKGPSIFVRDKEDVT
jgi:hypothetical protein